MKLRNQLIVGDSLEVLPQMPDGIFDLVITSPPYYNQRTYDAGGIGNEPTIEEYISNLMRIFSQCVRVVNDAGNIVFNIGDKFEDGNLMLIPYRFAIAVKREHPGLNLVNDITWVKKNPTPMTFNRRLIPSTESFFHWSKTSRYYYDRDSFMRSEDEELVPKPDTKIGMGYFDQIESSDLTSSQKDLARKELEASIDLIRQGRISGLRMKIKGVHSEPYGGQGGGRMNQISDKGFTIIHLHGKSMKRDVIMTSVESIPWMKHPAMFPVDVVEQLIPLLSREGGFVLDPFMGSGTTAMGCKRTGREYCGIEISEKYVEEALERIGREE